MEIKLVQFINDLWIDIHWKEYGDFTTIAFVREATEEEKTQRETYYGDVKTVYSWLMPDGKLAFLRSDSMWLPLNEDFEKLYDL